MSTKKNMDSVMSKWSEYQGWRLFCFVLCMLGKGRNTETGYTIPGGVAGMRIFLKCQGRWASFSFLQSFCKLSTAMRYQKTRGGANPAVCSVGDGWMNGWILLEEKGTNFASQTPSILSKRRYPPWTPLSTEWPRSKNWPLQDFTKVCRMPNKNLKTA